MRRRGIGPEVVLFGSLGSSPPPSCVQVPTRPSLRTTRLGIVRTLGNHVPLSTDRPDHASHPISRVTSHPSSHTPP
eukprot:5104078-Prymnesium_polylepis.1